jgi:predicted ATPase
MLMRLWCLGYQGWLFFFGRDVDSIAPFAEKTHRLGLESGILYWHIHSQIMLGWLEVVKGNAHCGIDLINQNISLHLQSGSQLILGFFYAVLADAYRIAGMVSEGMAALEKALDHCHRCGENWWLAEMHRLRGDLLAMAIPQETNSPQQWQQVADAYCTAYITATEQEARHLALRAAVSQARLWLKTGLSETALHSLEMSYSHFTEGFDTVDLCEAREVLEELGSAVGKRQTPTVLFCAKKQSTP